MADVLDQSEIDALLTAVNTGEVGEASAEPQIFSRFRRDREAVEIKDYDFKRPERISKDQMRALQTLHDTFARNFGASLSGFMRTIVEVRVANTEQMTYSEFIAGLPNPTSFNLIEARELDAQLCMEVSPLIVYPIIDRLLGGANQELVIPQRPMTIIETRLVRKILQRATASLSEAWESIKQIEFVLGDMESNPQIVQIVPPNEVVVVIGFEIKMTNRAGTMSLCIPFNVIEPLIDDLSAQSWAHMGQHRADEQSERLVDHHVSDVGVQVAAVLAETSITLSDLRNLEAGDLIVTDQPCTRPVLVAAEGVPKFLAQVGQYRGNRAVKIVRPVRPEDRLGAPGPAAEFGLAPGDLG